MNESARTVIVTGASRGIGEAAARHFAALGDKVVLLARSADRIEPLAAEIREAGGVALAFPLDVADFSAMRAAVDKVIAEFGSIEVLVNNAGVIEPIARIADSDPVAWSRAVDINLKGVYNGLRTVLPHMRGCGGVVVNISSGAATGALEGWSSYCASKAAVLSLTRCAHKEYGAEGIRVLGLSPGTVATEMQVTIRDSAINPVSRLDPSVHIPPEWVARAIAFLCTDAGEEYAGTDFSLKNSEGRRLMGLPPVGTG